MCSRSVNRSSTKALGGGSDPGIIYPQFLVTTSGLPHEWNAGGIQVERTPQSVAPAGRYECALAISNGGWINTPDFYVNAGQPIRVTLTYSRWTDSEDVVFGANLTYSDNTTELWGMAIDASQLPTGQWMSRSVTITPSRTGVAHILVWTGGGSTVAHIANLTIETALGGAVSR